MSRSIHETNRSVFRGLTAEQVTELCDPADPDPYVLQCAKKRWYKRTARQERAMDALNGEAQRESAPPSVRTEYP